MMARGRFITFEGIDGAGKSTQIEFVATSLRERGADVVVTREPGGTAIGEALRELVLRQPMSARTETLLVFAARAQHLDELILPALAAGRWVVCDRFTDATYAYQSGGRGVPEAAVEVLERWVHPDLQPDLTFLFDVPPDVAAQRLSAARAADRFEAERLDFFARVRAAYLERARRFPMRFVVLDGTQPPEVVRARLLDALDRWR
ncbi:MAG: dTMP kinase [Burkholderiaceae bacterium]|nr:dTMP kinase [Burkholderiaceae bacterium]